MEKLKVKTDSMLSDEEIITDILSGNKNIYEIIIRKYNQRLFRISRSLVKDSDEAEDVVQEAYIKAYEQLPLFKGNSRFSTWLTRILINEALARVKYRNRFNLIHTEDKDGYLSIYHKSGSVMQNPEEKSINQELKKVMENAIDQLPLKYKLTFMMREIENMNVAETSECLKISQSNVKVRLNRAKEMLRIKISDAYREADVYDFHLIRCDRIVAGVLNRVKEY